jgi:hypothetical protein
LRGHELRKGWKVNVSHPNLRRHQLVQQGAEEGGEGGVFVLVMVSLCIEY